MKTSKIIVILIVFAITVSGFAATLMPTVGVGRNHFNFKKMLQRLLRDRRQVLGVLDLQQTNRINKKVKKQTTNKPPTPQNSNPTRQPNKPPPHSTFNIIPIFKSKIDPESHST